VDSSDSSNPRVCVSVHRRVESTRGGILAIGRPSRTQSPAILTTRVGRERENGFSDSRSLPLQDHLPTKDRFLVPSPSSQ